MTTLNPLNIWTGHDSTKRALLILQHTHKSAANFLEAFEKPRAGKGKAAGTPTDKEQDLLRAMLLFAASGLDAMIKQLVRDALPIVVDTDASAHSELEKFVHTRLKLHEGDAKSIATDLKFLSSMVASKSPREAAIKELIKQLTANSLQSKDELLRAAAHFAIGPKDLTSDLEGVRNIFKVRNEIAHEMDIDFAQPNRKRFPRRRDDMVNYVNQIIQIASDMLKTVDLKCLPPTAKNKVPPRSPRRA